MKKLKTNVQNDKSGIFVNPVMEENEIKKF